MIDKVPSSDSNPTSGWMQLRRYSAAGFDRGCWLGLELLWLLVQALLITSWIPGSGHRVWLLRLFGARIGRGVVIKPRLRVKFPWRLEIGDDVWLGEAVWIDNLAAVKIADNCCISQGAYLCTGSHDWRRPSFDLITCAIEIEQGAWLAANTMVAPGVKIERGAVLSLGSVAVDDLKSGWIHQGNPAIPVKIRPQAGQHEG
jgi:putative colanic acid biosynthesis acetyltransferase WcaF